MTCQACRQENRDGRKFCAACGARLAVLCQACGTPNEIGEAFCGECGGQLARLGESPGSPVTANRTPKHLADKILQSRSTLEGERKQVTVLFADV